MNMGIVNKDNFFHIQKVYCCPIIDGYFKEITTAAQEKLKDKEIVILGKSHDEYFFLLNICANSNFHCSDGSKFLQLLSFYYSKIL